MVWSAFLVNIAKCSIRGREDEAQCGSCNPPNCFVSHGYPMPPSIRGLWTCHHIQQFAGLSYKHRHGLAIESHASQACIVGRNCVRFLRVLDWDWRGGLCPTFSPLFVVQSPFTSAGGRLAVDESVQGFFRT